MSRYFPKRHQLRNGALWALLVAAALVALVLIGLLAPAHRSYAVAAAALIFAIGATLWEPMTLPLLSMLTLPVVMRVGGGSLNLSLSDFVLFGAFWVAVIFTPRPFSSQMRAFLWLSFVYQVGSLFTVVGNLYRANTVEWFHAWVLVGGALVVGWAVARAGFASLALTLILISSAAIAVLVCIQGFVMLGTSGSFGPVYLEWPFGMHKNFVGCVMGFAAIVVYVQPTWLRMPTWVRSTLLVLFIVGILASQSRQALIGLGAGIVIACLRADPDRKRSKLILLAMIPAAVYVLLLVKDQLDSGNQFNSSFQRLAWYQQALTVWQSSPWYGVGLRWWTAGRTIYAFQPPNAELEVLTSVGLVGLIGFAILMIGGIAVVWRLPVRYGGLAVAILVTRAVQAQFDLFWVSVQVSVPFAIAGICMGAHARATALRSDERRTRGLHQHRRSKDADLVSV